MPPIIYTEDLCMLRPMQCGGYTYEIAVVWFSSGGTSSVLHTDDMENINCMLDGHKDIVFIDKVRGHEKVIFELNLQSFYANSYTL